MKQAVLSVRRTEHTCSAKGKRVEGKGHHTTGHGGPAGELYGSFILSLTTALDAVIVRLRPGRLTPTKATRYPLYRMQVGPQGRSERVLKMSPPPRFDPRILQPITRI